MTNKRQNLHQEQNHKTENQSSQTTLEEEI